MDIIAMNKLEKKDQGFLVVDPQPATLAKCKKCSNPDGQLIYHWIKDGDSDIKMFRVRCTTCGNVTSAHRSAELAVLVWQAQWNQNK